MIRSVRDLYGAKLHATDGEIGTVEEFYFDDTHWAVRYMVVDTGGWLTGRRVLISPIAIQAAHWDDHTINVALTREQVEQSPDVDTEKPVTRQYELSYLNYYGYPMYWEGGGLWGPGMNPIALAPVFTPMPMMPQAPAVTPADAATPITTGDNAANADTTVNPHLQSTRDVRDYTIAATDGDIGHVSDFLVDDETWAVRYLVLDTHNWLPGKHVLIAPAWIEKVSWPEGAVSVDLPRETIQDAPAYEAHHEVTRDYETQLYSYYQRPGYWETAPTQPGAAKIYAAE